MTPWEKALGVANASFGSSASAWPVPAPLGGGRCGDRAPQTNVGSHRPTAGGVGRCETMNSGDVAASGGQGELRRGKRALRPGAGGGDSGGEEGLARIGAGTALQAA